MKFVLVLAAVLQCTLAVRDSNPFAPAVFQSEISLLESPLTKSSFAPVKEKFLLKERSVVHKRSDVVKLGRARHDVHHEVIFSVKENLDELKTLVDDISNPHSANFGMHLNREEVTAITANPSSFNHVMAYLRLHNIEVVKTSKYAEFIHAVAPVNKWEQLLSTEFYEFAMQGEEHPMIRADHYSLSENLHEHVSAVFNTVQFPAAPRKRSVRTPYVKKISPLDSSDPYFGNCYPGLLNLVYDIRNNTGNLLGSQCLYETASQIYSVSDLSMFQSTFDDLGNVVDGLDDLVDDGGLGGTVGGTIGGIGGTVDGLLNSITNIGTPSTTTDPCELDPTLCSDANLAIQYLTSISQLTPTIFYSWNGSDFLLDWITQIAEMASPPKVISIPWGGPEINYGSSYISAFNDQALKLAAMGTTLIAAAGDNGASNLPSLKGPKYCAYHADFPAVSYYVTSVGATMGPESGETEVACSSANGGTITSGGGFSSYFSAPSWQTDAIASYFASAAAAGTTPYTGFNAGGRGFPDVSLMGHNYLAMNDGNLTVESGTSASSSVFAGMIALANAKRLAAGKSTLGWINPALYALGDQFVNDITQGENHCNSLHMVCCSQGFTATPGWDPVTGLGSLNFDSFLNIFFSLGDATDDANATYYYFDDTAVDDANATYYSASVDDANATYYYTSVDDANATYYYTSVDDAVNATVPSLAPAEAPLINTGWVFTSVYGDLACQGGAQFSQGWKIGRCFEGFNSAGTMQAYWKYNCDPNNAYVLVYSDPECNNLLQTQTFAIGCAYENHYYYYGLESYSYSLGCTASSDLFSFLDQTVEYAVQSLYDSEVSCDEADMSGFVAYQNDLCFSRPQSTSSFMYSYPDLHLFSGSSSCDGGVDTATALNATCTAYVGGLDDDDGSYYYYGHIQRSHTWTKQAAVAEDTSDVPSLAPVSVPTISNIPSISSIPSISTTFAPSVVATLMPTHSENYMMMVTQVLFGIDAAGFNGALANAEAYAASVAGCFEGIASTDVSITSCTDVGAAAAAADHPRLRRQLQISNDSLAVVMDYMIYYNLAVRGYSGDPDGCYADLVSTLIAAVNGTVFNEQLAENAVTYNAPDMGSCTTGPVTSTSYAAAAADDDNSGNGSDSSKDLSKRDKLIIGLTVGIGGFLLLVCLISACMYCVK